MTQESVAAQAEAIADFLRGTCSTLLGALLEHDMPESLENNAEFCACLDDRVFCCEDCSWWCELSEMSGEDGVCDDCAGGEE